MSCEIPIYQEDVNNDLKIRRELVSRSYNIRNSKVLVLVTKTQRPGTNLIRYHINIEMCSNIFRMISLTTQLRY